MCNFKINDGLIFWKFKFMTQKEVRSNLFHQIYFCQLRIDLSNV